MSMMIQPTMIAIEDEKPYVSMLERALSHDSKGNSEEKCVRCGWVMGRAPLNCNNDNTPHIFPSQLLVREQLARVLSEVREWVCDWCNHVYPGPPQPGVMCVVCPRCGGNTMPKNVHERLRAEAERDAYNAQIHRQYKTRDRALRVLKVLLTGDKGAMREVTKDYIAMDVWLSRDDFSDGEFDWMVGFIHE